VRILTAPIWAQNSVQSRYFITFVMPTLSQPHESHLKAAETLIGDQDWPQKPWRNLAVHASAVTKLLFPEILLRHHTTIARKKS
jgi:hypothetical protein